MDFEDSPEEAAFRAEARAWLEANAPRRDEGKPVPPSRREADYIARARAWQARKAAAGFACITWPKDYGGRGGKPIEEVIFHQEEARFDVPRGVFEIGLGMCIPTLMAFAPKAALERHVGPALRGEEIWCQLFSEPSGGSDLAGLRTRSERDGDHWVVNGQKVWTSGAHYSDFGILVTRSDPSAPKHKGLTYFYLSMKTPGVEVRPIKQISGASHFNEVYFTNVRIPDSQRLGAVGEGWKVALTTLMHERLAVGGNSGADMRELVELARSISLETGPALENHAVRERLAEWFVRSQGLKFTRYRALTALSRGEVPGPEASIGKVVAALKMQQIGTMGMDLQDMAGALLDPEALPMGTAFQDSFLLAPGLRIAGGTDEILRNVIAERVLGLPGDIRVDKDMPFNKLPTGA